VKKLTAKQEKFVQELIKGKSQREAYKAAYNAKNMSENSIDVEASKCKRIWLRYRYSITYSLKKRLRNN